MGAIGVAPTKLGAGKGAIRRRRPVVVAGGAHQHRAPRVKPAGGPGQDRRRKRCDKQGVEKQEGEIHRFGEQREVACSRTTIP